MLATSAPVVQRFCHPYFREKRRARAEAKPAGTITEILPSHVLLLRLAGTIIGLGSTLCEVQLKKSGASIGEKFQ
jgi:hypothetical protein